MEQSEAGIDHDFQLELDTDAPQLKHQPAAALDRNVIASVIGESGYKVTIKSVSYSTYHQRPACLFAMTVAFKWRDTKRSRVKAACIELNLQHVSANGETLEDEPGPKILLFTPEMIYGDPRDETRTKERSLGGSIGAGMPAGATASIDASRSTSITQSGERRMRIQGQKFGPMDPEIEDTAEWILEENLAQKNGIPDRFTCAVIIDWPETLRDRGIHVLCTVKPQLASSLMSRVLRLRPVRVDPIGLDGKTARGIKFAEGIDLADASVPWDSLLGSYKEYEVSVLNCCSSANADASSRIHWLVLNRYTAHHRTMTLLTSSTFHTRRMKPNDTLDASSA